jgi:hypothetical protein
LIAAARPSWVSVSGPAMINSFFHGLESVARGQNPPPHPNRARKITEPTGAQGRPTLFALP